MRLLAIPTIFKWILFASLYFVGICCYGLFVYLIPEFGALINVHSELGGVGAMLLSFGMLVSFIVLIIGVPKAILILLRHVEARTPILFAISIIGAVSGSLILTWILRVASYLLLPRGGQLRDF
jgi:hypothetical protein